jgi:TPR repeat protein
MTIPVREMHRRWVDTNGKWLPPQIVWTPQQLAEIPSAMVNYLFDYYNDDIAPVIAQTIAPSAAAAATLTLPLAMDPLSWRSTHRALIDYRPLMRESLSLDETIKVFEAIPMIDALDDNAAIAYAIKHNKQLQQIQTAMATAIGSYVLRPLIDMIMLYVPNYLQIGIGCEQRGDQPNAFRWFDAASYETLTNDPPTIGAACYKAAMYYRFGYDSCQMSSQRAFALLKLAVCARVRQACASLAEFFGHGLGGVTIDYRAAIHLTSSAADAMCPFSIAYVADEYLRQRKYPHYSVHVLHICHPSIHDYLCF